MSGSGVSRVQAPEPAGNHRNGCTGCERDPDTFPGCWTDEQVAEEYARVRHLVTGEPPHEVKRGRGADAVVALKASIRKRDGEWVLTRPPYGFASTAQVTKHPSWNAARAALLGSAPASAGASNQVGLYTLGLTANGWPARGTIRAEASRLEVSVR